MRQGYAEAEFSVFAPLCRAIFKCRLFFLLETAPEFSIHDAPGAAPNVHIKTSLAMYGLYDHEELMAISYEECHANAKRSVKELHNWLKESVEEFIEGDPDDSDQMKFGKLFKHCFAALRYRRDQNISQSDEYALRRAGLQFLVWLLFLAASGTAAYLDCDVSIHRYITEATEGRICRAEALVVISFLPEYATMERDGTEARPQTLIRVGSRGRALSTSDAEASVDQRSSSLDGLEFPVRGR